MKSKKRGTLANYYRGNKVGAGSVDVSANYHPFSKTSNIGSDNRSNYGATIKAQNYLNKDFPYLGGEFLLNETMAENRNYPSQIKGQPNPGSTWKKPNLSAGSLGSLGLTLGAQNAQRENPKAGFTTKGSYIGAGIGALSNGFKPYGELHPEIGYNTGSKRSGMGYSSNQYLYGNLDIKGNPNNNNGRLNDAIETGDYKANANIGYRGDIGDSGFSGFGQAGYNFLTKQPNFSVGIKGKVARKEMGGQVGYETAGPVKGRQTPFQRYVAAYPKSVRNPNLPSSADTTTANNPDPRFTNGTEIGLSEPLQDKYYSGSDMSQQELNLANQQYGLENAYWGTFKQAKGNNTIDFSNIPDETSRLLRYRWAGGPRLKKKK